MEDTRIQLLADIMSWAEAPNTPLVFWLNGLAGTGKSTVARTTCDRLASKGLLGASFFISRQVAYRRHAACVIRTIAYQLARQHHAFAKALSAILRDSPDLAASGGLQRLVTELLVKPANVLPADAGLLIVIDAMDECTTDSNGRPGGDMLPLLLRGLFQLSRRVKILLTSRAEPEIDRMFSEASSSSQHTVMQLHNLDGALVRSDIRTYLTRSFASITTARPHLALHNWPSQEDIDMLVDLADVLFVFAATVVRFVDTPRQNPRTRLDVMLARREGSFASPYRSLDQVYLQVLRMSIASEHKEENVLSQTLKAVVGFIIVAQAPLPIEVHAIFLDTEPDDARCMVQSLSALLLSTNDEPVRIFHPSFPDFITTPRRCNDPRFLVALDHHHLRLARACLRLLNRYLRHNIADLDHPDVANSDVEDLDDRLLRSIRRETNDKGLSPFQALLYAARHWTTHVASASEMDSELLVALSDFCHDHLLHWLELLSLIRSLGHGTQSNLLTVISWTTVRSFYMSVFPADRFASHMPTTSGFPGLALCFATLCMS
jgi:hypothetical protein